MSPMNSAEGFPVWCRRGVQPRHHSRDGHVHGERLFDKHPGRRSILHREPQRRRAGWVPPRAGGKGLVGCPGSDEIRRAVRVGRGCVGLRPLQRTRFLPIRSAHDRSDNGPHQVSGLRGSDAGRRRIKTENDAFIDAKIALASAAKRIFERNCRTQLKDDRPHRMRVGPNAKFATTLARGVVRRRVDGKGVRRLSTGIHLPKRHLSGLEHVEARGDIAECRLVWPLALEDWFAPSIAHIL